jgi:hypothetical protein
MLSISGARTANSAIDLARMRDDVRARGDDVAASEANTEDEQPVASEGAAELRIALHATGRRLGFNGHRL